MNHHWIYHPNEKAKVVDSNEYHRLLDRGWYDSPNKFPKGVILVNGRKTAAPVVVKDDADNALELNVMDEIDKEADVLNLDNDEIASQEKKKKSSKAKPIKGA